MLDKVVILGQKLSKSVKKICFCVLIQVELNCQRVPGVQGQDQTTHEKRSLFYDIVIAVVIVIIALLIYRRLTLDSEITSSSPPAN